MKRWNMIFTGKAAKKENRRNNQVYESLFWASAHPEAEVMKRYGTSRRKNREKRTEKMS